MRSLRWWRKQADRQCFFADITCPLGSAFLSVKASGTFLLMLMCFRVKTSMLFLAQGQTGAGCLQSLLLVAHDNVEGLWNNLLRCKTPAAVLTSLMIWPLQNLILAASVDAEHFPRDALRRGFATVLGTLADTAVDVPHAPELVRRACDPKHGPTTTLLPTSCASAPLLVGIPGGPAGKHGLGASSC